MLDPSSLTVVTATALEMRETRRLVPGVHVVRVGVAFATPPAEALGPAVISCGLAGGLRRGLAAGSVLIPHHVVRPNGERLDCDPQLVQALEDASRRLGFEPVADPLLTSETLVRGASRDHWAEQGFAGVDMETGLIFAARIAAVRVILDSPERELSESWLHPWRALLDPQAWRELPWLAKQGPRCARRAAQVLREALTRAL